MNLDVFKEFTKGLATNDKFSNVVSNFIKELSNAIEKHNKGKMLSGIREGDINVIYGLIDEKVTLLNVENGKEQEIYVSTSDESIKKLHNNGIYDNIYETDKETFYSWNFGTKLIMQNGKLNIYNGEIKINDDETWYKLDDFYASIKADENKNFIVKEVTDDKVILNYENGGGFISRPKEMYPNFEVGDVVKKINDKFIKE